MNTACRSYFLLSLALAAVAAHASSGAEADPPRHRAGEPFELTVVGPGGKPLPGVTVDIRTTPLPTDEQVTRGTFVRARQHVVETTADEEGRLTVALPERFTLYIKSPGLGLYIPNWKYGAPARFTAELDAGWSIGGIVVDLQDQPIEGATVSLFIERPYQGQQMDAKAEAKTDASGEWRYDSVPMAMKEVEVLFEHPHFTPAGYPLPRTIFGLQDGAAPSAGIRLERGRTVEGIVTDDAGQPIAGALVRFKSSNINVIREATTGDDGHYQLTGCSPGIARIVVSAPERALEVQQVSGNFDKKPVNFELKPGNTIRVRVLDAAGAPVPKTRIFFQRWRGPIGYFEFDHVHPYTDENGIWVWNEAPLDEIHADICPPDGMQLGEQPLLARSKEYVFRTSGQLIVSGLVVDSETGQPIDRFRATMGSININTHYILWDTQNACFGEGGKYRVKHGWPTPYVVRIEADGYHTAKSRELKSDEGEVTIDFELERTQPQRDAGGPAQ